MTLHAQTFCHACGNRMETTYASGVAHCDNWKAFVSVLYSKCKTRATAGTLYIAMLHDSTRHRTRDIRLALVWSLNFVWLKEFDAKIYFRAAWSGFFFFGYSLKNPLSRIMQFIIYIFYLTISRSVSFLYRSPTGFSVCLSLPWFGPLVAR